MFTKHVILAFFAFVSGAGVAAGTFAFILVIGVVPRILRKTNLAKKVLLIETLIASGGIVGNAISVFEKFSLPGIVSVKHAFPAFCFRAAGHLFVAVYGICAGIFVGCISVALAEILNTFPIMFKRLRLKTGLSWVMLMMALGKFTGALFYFLTGYDM